MVLSDPSKCAGASVRTTISISPLTTKSASSSAQRANEDTDKDSAAKAAVASFVLCVILRPPLRWIRSAYGDVRAILVNRAIIIIPSEVERARLHHFGFKLKIRVCCDGGFHRDIDHSLAVKGANKAIDDRTWDRVAIAIATHTAFHGVADQGAHGNHFASRSFTRGADAWCYILCHFSNPLPISRHSRRW